jgi:hypothetical protein
MTSRQLRCPSPLSSSLLKRNSWLIRSLDPFLARGSDVTRNEEDEQIYAVALLTRKEASLLGPAFARIWRVESTPCFGELLAAIDEADREHWRKKDLRED